MRIEIKHWLTGSILFEGDFSCIKTAVEAAVANRASLVGARLDGASLDGASLDRASLVGASLVGASLVGASLVGARLDRARLDGAGHTWAQVSFKGHGEYGRMLTALVRKKGDEPELFCGCFTGSFADLEEYIAEGNPKLRRTRTLAMETVRQLLTAENDK